MSNYISTNLGKDEQIVYQAQVPISMLAIPIIVGGLLAIPTVGLGLLIAVPAIITYTTTELAITNKKVIGKTGMINTSALDSPLNRIDNVSVNVGLLGKILGYGKLEIRTTAGVKSFVIDKPELFKNKIFDQIDQFEEDKVTKQAEKIASAVK